MAGHSKWANIKFRKSKQDAKKGKIFTKFIREITVAARESGGDPGANPRLRMVMDKAFAVNMTRDTIERAIKRGVGDLDGARMEEVRYEGYAAGGVAVLVECLTDNRNRTVPEVRHVFTKCGGNLGTDGSVSYLFAKTGTISLPPGITEEQVMEIALEAGASDLMTHEDNSLEITTTPEYFHAVQQALEKAGFKGEAELAMVAATRVVIDDEELAEKIVRLQDMLEDLDDVQNVYTNAEIPDAILEKIV